MKAPLVRRPRRQRSKLTASRAYQSLLRRIYLGASALLLVVGVGTVGYWRIGHGEWGLGDCAYMTLITISTVGYGETLAHMNELPAARAWTVLLILGGSGTLLYFASTLTAFVVEGDLGGALKRNRMQQQIDAMRGHFIVCGAGRTGLTVIRELLATATDFVVVETSEERVREVIEELGQEFLCVLGSAEDDEVLLSAGIDRARGLAAALPADRDNLFVTLSARALNRDLRIVAKAVELHSDPKLRRAGADAVVSTTYIGGMRLCSELIRPQVVEFLDLMLRASDQNLRVSQLEVRGGSSLDGRTLGEAGVSKARDVLIMALRQPDGEYIYLPRPSVVLRPGAHIIVLSDGDTVNQWQKAIDR